MSTVTISRDRYLETLLDQATTAAEQSGLGLQELRAAARALVQEQTFPSNRDEAWRFTSGFCRDVFNKLPMEFAAEADKLLALKLENSVG